MSEAIKKNAVLKLGMLFVALVLALALWAVAPEGVSAEDLSQGITAVNATDGTVYTVEYVGNNISIYTPDTGSYIVNITIPESIGAKKLEDYSSWPAKSYTRNDKGYFEIPRNTGRLQFSVNYSYKYLQFVLATCKPTAVTVPGDHLERNNAQVFRVDLSNTTGAEVKNAKVELLIGDVVIGSATMNIPTGTTAAYVTGDLTNKDLSADTVAVGKDVSVTAKVSYGETANTAKGTFAVNNEMTADTSWYNTTDKEFTLTTPDQLRGFAKIVNGAAVGIAADNFEGKTVKLGSDISMGALSIGGVWSGSDFVPIGAADYAAFAGTFDGQNHAIRNFYCASTKNAKAVGLFGYLTGTVKNLYMESGAVVGTSSTTKAAGGIVGYNMGVVENCGNAMKVEAAGGGSNSVSASGAGGIAGGVGAASFLKDSAHTVHVDSGVIRNCYNTGKILNNLYAGGIAGGINEGYISYCYNAGTVSSSSSNAGGITAQIGCSASSQVRIPSGVYNCYNVAIIDGSSARYSGGIYVDKGSTSQVVNCFTKKGTADGITPNNENGIKTTAEMKKAAFVTELNNGSNVFVSDSKANDGFPVLKWTTGAALDALYDINIVKTDPKCVALVSSVPVTDTYAGAKVTLMLASGSYSNGFLTADSITITDGNGKKIVPEKVDYQNYTFTMPETKVDISVNIDEVPYVTDVTASAANNFVAPGSTVQLSAEATGGNNPPQTFTWKLEGNASSATTINDSGLLTIAADETSMKLTATAASTLSPTRTASVTIVVGKTWEGEGTEENPYLLKTIDDLNLVGALLSIEETQTGKYFALGNDIDFSAVKTWTPLGVYTGMTSWGSVTTKYAYFNGSLDGKGFGFTNLKIKNADADFSVFYGFGEAAVVKNIKIDGKINTTSGGIYPLVQDIKGHLENCTATGTFHSDTGEVTGIFETIEIGGVVDNCHFDGTISAGTEDDLGGRIAGLGAMNKGVLKNSTAKGTLDGGGAYAAGIVLEQQAAKNTNYTDEDFLIENCTNYANITRVCEYLDSGRLYDTIQSYGAGIAYQQRGGIIRNCVNYGDIALPESTYIAAGKSSKGDWDARTVLAGIVGNECGSASDHRTGRIESCANYGTLSGYAVRIGGIVGSNVLIQSDYEVRDCVNYGKIDSQFIYGKNISGGNSYAGGIVGYSSSTGTAVVENVKNYGDLTAAGDTSVMGGIVGRFNGYLGRTESTFALKNSANMGSVRGYVAGGIAGLIGITNAVVENNYNQGTIHCTIYVDDEKTSPGVACGILGMWQQNNGKNATSLTLRNNYTVGKISGEEGSVVTHIFGAYLTVDDNTDVSTFADNYYLAAEGEAAEENATAKTEEEMKSADFVQLLNDNAARYVAPEPTEGEGEGDVTEPGDGEDPVVPVVPVTPFKAGSAYYQNGYPILSWEKILTVVSAEGVSVEVAEDMTSLTVKVADGYLLKDVLVNGESKGNVTELTDLTVDDVVSFDVITVQQPTVNAGEGAIVTLSDDGAVAEIAISEGYLLDDVIVNGESKGKVTSVSDLKTGDTLEVKTIAVQKPEVKANEGGTAVLNEDGTELTITADEEYVIKDVIVNGKSVGAVEKVTDLKTGDSVEVVFGPAYTCPYTDVPDDAWFAKSVNEMTKVGLFKGVSDTEFGPEVTVNRAMFVTILGRLYEKQGNTIADAASTVFTDVPAGSYYAKYVAWGNENEIVMGVSATEFAPDDAITREQMAALMYRFAGFLKQDVTASADITTFVDSAKVSEWATPAVKWAVASGLIKGMGDNSLAPQNKSTRAQAAEVMYRFMNLLNK